MPASSNRRVTAHQSVFVASHRGSEHEFSLATLRTSKVDAAQELEAKARAGFRDSASTVKARARSQDQSRGYGAEFVNDLSTSFPFGPEVNPCCGNEVPCRGRAAKKGRHGGARIPSVIRKQRFALGFQRPGLKLENQFRVRMKTGAFHHERIEYIAEVPPRAALRLEYLLGTNKVRLNDRHYMHELHHGLVDVEEHELKRKEQERELQEQDRVKKLVIDGAMDPTPDLEYLYDHPSFRVNEMLRRLEHHDALLAQAPPPNKSLVEVYPFEYNAGAYFRYLHKTGRTDYAPKEIRAQRREKWRGKIERARERKRLAELGAKEGSTGTLPHTVETLYHREDDAGKSTIGNGSKKPGSSSSSWETDTDSDDLGSEYTYKSDSSEESKKDVTTTAAKAVKSAKATTKKDLNKSRAQAQLIASKVSAQISHASQRGFLNPSIMEDLRDQEAKAKAKNTVEETPEAKEARLRKIKECYGIKSNEKLNAIAAAAAPSKAQKQVLGCLEAATNTEELFECGQSLRRVYLRQGKVAEDFCKYLGRFMTQNNYKH